ncbi:MAG: hypothetical protein Q9195_002915 [Heterodermia aff. obscurata]
MGIATPIPIFDPVSNPPELADDELVLLADAPVLAGTCAELILAPAPPELAVDVVVAVEDILGPVETCVELKERIVELMVDGGSEDAVELAIAMGL